MVCLGQPLGPTSYVGVALSISFQTARLTRLAARRCKRVSYVQDYDHENGDPSYAYRLPLALPMIAKPVFPPLMRGLFWFLECKEQDETLLRLGALARCQELLH